ncbi:helix-turn-helix domain-containing protein [Methylovirgula sp. 4M-Z18]|uniref:helix-turn-helix domain-containing protein n=1 Tax=Methylovirgula sp. 4M-Z18 TaxID=2293567 RepID=UPI000E2ED5BD|nr:helix-turn-helix transcriptional regulator [Methylovirgula sp. 4M-Z18]RFB78596.1 XRE family transcriptional regulator [Methylovirgula sp. 4M-Z18]
MNVVEHGAMGLTRVVDQFEAIDLKAPFKVVLHNSVKVTVDKTTREPVSYRIPDLDGLLRAVVIARILHPRKLFGPDIKFLRKAVSLKQKELASKIELSVEHLSRCESSTQVLAPSTEKLLRIFVLKTAMKLYKIKACDAKAKLEDALDRLFDVIKPVSVFDVNECLELHFHRSRPLKDAGGNEIDDGTWDGEPEAA